MNWTTVIEVNANDDIVSRIYNKYYNRIQLFLKKHSKQITSINVSKESININGCSY